MLKSGRTKIIALALLAMAFGSLVTLLTLNFVWNNKQAAEIVSPHYLLLTGCSQGYYKMGCITEDGEIVSCRSFVEKTGIQGFEEDKKFSEILSFSSLER